MADVFISYARESQSVAKRLAARLTAAGFEVWWDEQIPAHRAYGEVIEERLRAARCVIVLWSQDAVRSQWVRAEADVARTQGKLVQAVIDDCTPPLPFDQLQFTDLQGWNGAQSHPGWRRIEASARALNDAGGPPQTPPPVRASALLAKPRLALALGVAAVATMLALGGWLIVGRSTGTRADQASIAVRPLTAADPALKVFAASLDDQIVDVLTGKGMTPLTTVGDGKAALIVDGRVQAVADKLLVAMRVSTGKDHVSLWSTSFQRAARDTTGFPDEVAAKISDIMQCAVWSSAPKLDLTNATRSLYLNMCDLRRQMERTDEVFDLARQIEQQAPNFVRPEGDVAVAGALSLARLPPEQAIRIRQESARAADRVLLADPLDGNGYLAKSLLVVPRNDWRARERWLDEGLSKRDDATLNSYKANILEEVGRLNEALLLVRRSLAMDPKSPPKTLGLVYALGLTGDLTAARTQYGHLRQVWPNRPESRLGAFELTAFSDPGAALRLLEQADTRPEGVTDEGVLTWRAYAKVRATRSSADVAAAKMALARALDGRSVLRRDIVVRALLTMGLMDEVEAYYRKRAADGRFVTTALFSFEAKTYRANPRFMRLARDIGLTAYWRAMGKWPDFCKEEVLPYNCEDLRG